MLGKIRCPQCTLHWAERGTHQEGVLGLRPTWPCRRVPCAGHTYRCTYHCLAGRCPGSRSLNAQATGERHRFASGFGRLLPHVAPLRPIGFEYPIRSSPPKPARRSLRIEGTSLARLSVWMAVAGATLRSSNSRGPTLRSALQGPAA